MTKTVTRYTQPCIQIQHSPEFSTAEVPLFEDPNGKWVRYDDIKHLLAAEPKAGLVLKMAEYECGCVNYGGEISACAQHATKTNNLLPP